MAISSAASGTQTATLGVEHTLATITTAGTYVLNVDAANLVNAETLTLRLKSKTLSGGTLRLTYENKFRHIQGQPSIFSVPVPTLIEVVATLQQDGGTGRAFPWNLIRIDA
ncbi:MAG: hypothetical protein ACRDGM_00705 [bacterium]